jgi:hypothetical protein
MGLYAILALKHSCRELSVSLGMEIVNFLSQYLTVKPPTKITAEMSAHRRGAFPINKSRKLVFR